MSLKLSTPADALAWLRQRLVAPGAQLHSDSRRVRPGDAFIAWPGRATDGRHLVAAALAAGAAACLVEADGAEAFGWGAAAGAHADTDTEAQADARVATLAGLKAATGLIAAGWFKHPGRLLDVVAVTATNGKSSTAWWTAQALSALGRRCGVVGTLGIGEPPRGDLPGSVLATGLTTPDPITLQAALRRMADEGYAACALEASSIGLAEHRLAGTPIAVAQYINFTRDHLDYHGDMANYWAAKRQLFQWPGLRAAVVDLDDAQGAQLATELAAAGLALWTCALNNAQARLRGEDLHHSPQGLAFTLAERLPDGVLQRVPVRSRLIGDYNAHNLLAVIGALRALGVPLQQAADLVPQLTPVPGRMQRVTLAAAAPATATAPAAPALPELVVDYAHTPDALDKALGALQPMTIARGGRLWCVFGCGGNRDASKRPLMGAIAQLMADRVVITSDNPRDEAPAAILQQIRAGMDDSAQVQLIEDRADAIAQVVAQADPQDVVLLAGKGHEDYQEVAGTRRPFSDLALAAAALARRAGPAAPLQAGTGPLAPAPAPAQRAPALAPMMTLADAMALLPGAQPVGVTGSSGLTPIWRVHTDSRSLRPGDLFVALRGERFDAHDFLPQARAAGAVAALAERGLADAGLPGLQVPDALQGLQQLASAWRQRFELPLVAVTGSNGKTTVTQMLAAILRAWLGDAALATAGNFNNHIGLPLTLLRLRPQHRAAVMELGMNHPGEIAQLALLARPTVALVNNAQREHQEFMASVAAVAEENGSVISALAADGVAVYPADDPHAPVWQTLAGARRQLCFALDGALQYTDAAAQVSGLGQWQADPTPAGSSRAATGPHWVMTLRTPAGTASTTLQAPGQHNLRNALAAAACALAAGAPLDAVVQGLADFRPVAGRSQLTRVIRGGLAVTLVNDSYNANPDSVRAAIDLLAGLPGPHWLVLGDMGEVGEQGPAFHAEVGAYARAAGIAALWTAGAQSAGAADAFGAGARHFVSTANLVAALADGPHCGAVLVKGSRFMAMEAVVQALLAASDPTTGGHVHVA